MENNNSKTQIKQLSQQVEDLQLHVSNTDATKKKGVRFSDDSAPLHLIEDDLPSMSASSLEEHGQDLLKFGQKISRELVKRRPLIRLLRSTSHHLEKLSHRRKSWAT